VDYTFFYGKGNETKLYWQQVFFYTTEEYKQLRQFSPLVTGIIYSSERSVA